KVTIELFIRGKKRHHNYDSSVGKDNLNDRQLEEKSAQWNLGIRASKPNTKTRYETSVPRRGLRGRCPHEMVVNGDTLGVGHFEEAVIVVWLVVR
ncbi:hypothetical protein A2U01_0021865, partial [Trifolium medium]|nr:hypothetical protein [Trifolium medium]